MGLLRKLTYLGTRGVIDLRTDSERVESYARRLEERKDPRPRPGRRTPRLSRTRRDVSRHGS